MIAPRKKGVPARPVKTAPFKEYLKILEGKEKTPRLHRTSPKQYNNNPPWK
jgi:hypothetical protein